MKSLQFALRAVAALSLSGSTLQAAPNAVTELLTEAQTAYLRGELSAAKAKFESVNKLDPKNQTAIGYLKMIQAREAQGVSSSPQERQLAKLILPKVDFKDATLTAALDFLKQSVTKLTDDKQAVNFVVQLPEAQANTAVTLSLRNVPFTEVLKYVGSLAGVSFTYDRYAIMVRPVAPTAQATTAPAVGQ